MYHAENPFSLSPFEGDEPSAAEIRGYYEPEEPEGPLPLQDEEGYDRSWPVADGMTFDVISAKYQQFVDAWVYHPLRRASYRTLENSVLKQGRIQITHAVCLGLGSFTGAYANEQFNVLFQERVLWQLIAFESWIDKLRMRFDIEHIYFQDPAFSTLDRKFLRSQGYKILHSPESENYIDRHTFLFTPCAEQMVEESCLSTAFPALYMTNDLTCHSNYHTPPRRIGIDPRPRREDRLPAKEHPARRELFQSFLERSAIVPVLPTDIDEEVPVRELFWLQHIWLYYKPDNHADRSDFKWKLEDEQCYTYGEAV
ncbi:hypothetical protein G7Y79_00007g022320 [Physcia stellaris]|nr:hypothetical protein G7Y79_00007g022320 [Physcia stellaris]